MPVAEMNEVDIETSEGLRDGLTRRPRNTRVEPTERYLMGRDHAGIYEPPEAGADPVSQVKYRRS